MDQKYIEDLFSKADMPLTEADEQRLQLKMEKAISIVSKTDDGFCKFQTCDVPVMERYFVFNLTPKLARKLLRFNLLPSQRTIMDNRLRDLARKMRDGRYHGNDIALARFDGGFVMVNGQHCCHACVTTEKSSLNAMKVFICNTERQLACCWAQFDNGGNRTPKQVAKSYASSFGKEWHEVGIMLASVALSLWEYGSSGIDKAGTLEERFKLIEKYPNESKFLRDIVFHNEPESGKRLSADCRMLNRGPVALAMLMSFEEDKYGAKKFWMDVRSGLGLNSPSQPQYALRNYLQSITMSNTNPSDGKKREANSSITGKCMYAWSFYQMGAEIPRVRRGTRESFPLKEK